MRNVSPDNTDAILNTKVSVSEANAHEVKLLQKIANDKDSKALEALYKIYHPRLAGFLYRMTKDDSQISELINEVMYSVWKYAGQFKGTAKVSTWIFTIAYREFCKIIKKSKRQTELLNEVAEEKLIEEQNNHAHDDSKIESNELIQKALEYLSPEHRMAIELSYFSGYTIVEIAAIAQCPENTIKTRMFHARRKLRDVVTELSIN